MTAEPLTRIPPKRQPVNDTRAADLVISRRGKPDEICSI